MNARAEGPLFSVRDRRILLAVCAAAVCWRWILAARAPLPRVEAVLDLWSAAAFAAGDFAPLAEVWSGPWWGLLLAPAIAATFEPFEVAKVLGCVVSGVALIPIAAAAERLAAGAGLAAALLLFSVPEPALGAAGGSAVGLHLLFAGLAAWALASRRRALAAVFVVVMLADLAPRGGAAFAAPAFVALAVLAGLGLARLPVRLRDLVLTAAVAVMFWLTWRGVEPESVVVERYLGEFVAERVPPDRALVTGLPRVSYYAGRRPARLGRAELAARLAGAEAEAAVLRRDVARELAAELGPGFGRGFERFRLSPRFEDLAAEHGVAVWFRRE